MIFEITDVDALGRIGFIKIKDKKMDTPNIFPVIHPIKNSVTIQELKKIGAQGIFTNAYIIYNNEEFREKVLKNGVHKIFNFDGLVATDSGAFQQYMYNNDEITIDSEIIEKFQENIGSDFPVILDIPIQLNDSYEVACKKLKDTLIRARQNIVRRTSIDCNWFGPIHGGKYLDLVKECCDQMNQMDFAVYAVGGLVKTFLDYRFDLSSNILLTAKKNLIPEKPIHMFGLGLPQYFALAIACGCDLMDSAAYVLYAKEGRYFTLSSGTKKLEDLEEFPCHCPICTNYTPKEIKQAQEDIKTNLLARHNLYLSFSELRTIRQAIRDGNLWELLELRIRNHPKLVSAMKVIKKNVKLFESHEKIYKTHGRLYASFESIFRPDFYRYKSKLLKEYRIPLEAKFMIILPELDIKGDKSPNIKLWLNKIYSHTQKAHHIHIYYFSPIYGIIPEELIDSYPLGQYEHIFPINEFDLISENSLKICKQFFSQHSIHYNKIFIIIPNQYLNEFNELIDFPKDHPIQRVKEIISENDDFKVEIFYNIDDLINKIQEIEK